MATCLVLLFLFWTSAFCQNATGGAGVDCPLPCVRIEHCEAAQELLLQRTDAARTRVKGAYCGRDDQQQVTVCCDTLLSDLDSHPSMALLPEDCGQIKGDRIVGGEEAALKEFPWMVLISYSTHGILEFQCGGTLITPRYVLTAAHCLAGLGRKQLVGVRLGEHNILTEEDCQQQPPHQTCQHHLQDVRIGEVIPHEQYVGEIGRIRNDIGLIRLKKEADLTHDNVGVVCLPRSAALRAVRAAGENATVTGWGATDSGRSSPVLMKVNVLVHSEQACSDFWNKGKPGGQETANKLCAGVPGKDSCSGDSGGPLVLSGSYLGKQRFVQHGIVSYGPRACGSSFPGVYTRVGPYMKWILDHIKP